jgi:protein-S-isoprenylcysteine O-methyltransferase Ste14
MLRLGLVLKFAIVLAGVAAILFGSAGTLDLPFFWAYLGLLAMLGFGSMLALPRDLIEERYVQRAPSRDNLALLRCLVLAAFLAQWIIAGLDVGRFHASKPLPPVVQLAALAGFAASIGGWYWAMRSNPFFSPAVRIQHDRGHRVATAGPYAIVRHPGYASFTILGACGPIALGSWWALLPHLIVAAAFFRRAAFEDRMLRAELEGYADYATQVRFRLVPGVW